MRHEVKKKASITALSVGIILLLASTANGTGLMDRIHSLAEQAWQDEYIPDSGLPTTPLTDYDDFEVTELFRAVTIEDLEASITIGYPMPWLEEILKDETIPWEDRYWLDCRMRAAIAQNTNTFFNPAGSPVHVEADGIFSGEYYWREHLIVDPTGEYSQDRVDRPIHPSGDDFGSGYILNSFGRNVGEIAVASREVSLSRDASIGVHVTGERIHNDDYSGQYYFTLLHPDGSFTDIPFENLGNHVGRVSQDGERIVFTRKTHPDTNPGSNVDIFDRTGYLVQRIQTDLYSSFNPISISRDGHYAWIPLRGPEYSSALIDCSDGDVVQVIQPNQTESSTMRCSFSTDGSYLCVGGGADARLINLATGDVRTFLQTALRPGSNDGNLTHSSSKGYLTAVVTMRKMPGEGSVEMPFSRELRVYAQNEAIYCQEFSVPASGYRRVEPIVSPNGYFVIFKQKTGIDFVFEVTEGDHDA
ncbi:MAG: hypothetical protein KAS73_08095 [Candidatus Sabulitectum sp.]|nr:hypothetical protein [Candidatus Sabulitectum sp.]